MPPGQRDEKSEGLLRSRMLSPDAFRLKHSQGLDYRAYVASGTPDQQENWARAHARVGLTPEQQALIASFTRQIHVLVTSGLWCGDCAAQVPMFDHIQRANSVKVSLRMLDRDKHKDLAEAIKICGGLRVPTAVFLNEDFEFLALLGDGTLSRYRAKAEKQLGASCPLPGAEVPDDESRATMQEWVDQIERAHLIARLSPRLRGRHED